MTKPFVHIFEKFANNPCIRDGKRSFSYAQTLEMGRCLTAGLPRSRALVALQCSVTAESIAAYIALMADGHVPLLIETDLSNELAEQLFATYTPDAIIDPTVGAIHCRGTAPVRLHQDLGLLLTTSGSTGSPKLVRLMPRGIIANATAIAEYLELSSIERPLLHLPMSYSFGLSVINSHLVAGACICLTRKSVMEAGYWDDLRAYEATSISGVPFHYSAVRRLGEAKFDISSLKTMTQAGGRLDPRLAEFFINWSLRSGRRFFIMYGQTEAGPRIAYLPPNRAVEATDAIGVPIPGASIELIDAQGLTVAKGEPGEIRVHSPAIMMGYATKSEDLALGDELHGVLDTGDIGQIGSDGLLRIVGRRSRILKIFGLRVNVDEIEQRLAAIGFAAFCFGEEDKLKVLIEGPADAGELRQRIIELFSLPPRGIEVRVDGHVERTSSGKIAAAALADAWASAA